MWLPMVVHSPPLMTPMFLTDRMVKKRSLSALSFQFLFILTEISVCSVSYNQAGDSGVLRRDGLGGACVISHVQVMEIAKELLRDGNC